MNTINKIIPLHNFDLEAKSLKVNDVILIRPLLENERKQYFKTWFFGTISKQKEYEANIKFAIVHKENSTLRGRLSYVDNMEFLIIKALKIFKFGHFQIGTPFFVSNSSKSGIKKGDRYPDIKYPRNFDHFYCNHKYILKKKENNSFIRFLRRYLELKEYLKLPTDLFSQINFCDHSNYRINIINSATVLESLLLRDDQELNYKLSLRAATLIGKTYTEKQEARLILKNLYTLRSYTVHGITDLKKYRKLNEQLFRNLKKIGSQLEFNNKTFEDARRSIEIVELLYEKYLSILLKKFIEKSELISNPAEIDFLFWADTKK